MILKANATCAYCGIRFYRVYYKLNRSKREGKAIHCSRTCGIRAYYKKKKEEQQEEK